MGMGVPPPKAFPPPMAMGQSGTGAVLNDSGTAQPGAQLTPYSAPAPTDPTTQPQPAAPNAPTVQAPSSIQDYLDPNDPNGDINTAKRLYRQSRMMMAT